MKVTIKIDCDNAAFSETPTHEITRILQELEIHLRGMGDVWAGYVKTLKDINGNTVGTFKVAK